MTEKTKSMTYDLDGTIIKITARRATARLGVQRFQMMYNANKANESETDEALKVLRVVAYPDAVCGTESVEGMEWPMEFEKFIDLPEDLTNKWSVLVHSINPQWRNQEVGEDAEKKEKS